MIRLFNIILLLSMLSGCVSPPGLENDIFFEQADISKDEAPHVANSLEWWYATGWLKDVETGDTFGIEFVMFYFSMNGKKDRLLSNVAITDVSSDKFYFDHTLIGLNDQLKSELPLQLSTARGKSQASIKGQFGEYEFVAKGHHEGEEFSYTLNTVSNSPAVLHGNKSGYENYGGYAKAGYYSYTDLATEGQIMVDGKLRTVKGSIWYDRQWNCGAVLQNRTTGWDWMSISLNESNEKLMLYRLLLREGLNIYGGTLVREDGTYSSLKSEEISIRDKSYWKSKRSGDRYPSKLEISIPNHRLELSLSMLKEEQELAIKILPLVKLYYWEGMCAVSGTRDGEPVTGTSYLEITNPENREK
jgi:predicted secreted hydrolase